MLGTYQEQLKFPLGYDQDQASSFSSLTLSCGVSNFPVASPAPATVHQNITAIPTSTAAGVSKSCSSTYAIQEGNDCHSISRLQQVFTAEMSYLNNFEAGCPNFPAMGTKLCMPHKYRVYTVKADDTCYGIIDAYNSTFTMYQFISWNVDINCGCDNLEIFSGNQICVSFPGNASAPTVTGAPAKQSMPTFSYYTPGATARDDSCYATTYATLPPWTWSPVNTETNTSAGSSSSIQSLSYSSIPVTPVPSFSTYSPSH